jgi:hypothetical protein
VIDRGLLDHRDGLALAHLIHRVDRLARIFGRQTISELPNVGGIGIEGISLLEQPVADIRPRIGRCGRPQAPNDRSRERPRRH